MPQSTIQCMGTPFSQFFAASPESLFEFGLRWVKRASSRARMAVMAVSGTVRAMISLVAVNVAQSSSMPDGGLHNPHGFGSENLV